MKESYDNFIIDKRVYTLNRCLSIIKLKVKLPLLGSTVLAIPSSNSANGWRKSILF